MKNTILKDQVIRVTNKFIGQRFEHTNLSKLDKTRILKLDYSGADYQLKKGDIVIFDRSNNWDLSYYKTPCGVEFKLDCGYNYFEKL